MFYLWRITINDDNKKLTEYYENYNATHDGDSGVDIPLPSNVEISPKSTTLIDLGIKGEMYKVIETTEGFTYKPSGYYLYPRSSISKTPLRLANSVGIIDASYRGTLKAAVDHIKDTDEPYILNEGARLVQICAPDLSSVSVQVVGELTSTSRGEGGFGSTGLEI